MAVKIHIAAKKVRALRKALDPQSPFPPIVTKIKLGRNNYVELNYVMVDDEPTFLASAVCHHGSLSVMRY